MAAIGVEEGILLAIALSLVRHVRHSYRPHTMVLAQNAGGWREPVPAAPGIETEPGLIVYRFGADLFYANGDRFADEVRALVEHAPHPVSWFVIDASAITDIDYSAARSVRDLIEDLAQRDINLAFARVNPYLRSDLERHGITAAIGDHRIFATLHEALAAVGRGARATDFERSLYRMRRQRAAQAPGYRFVKQQAHPLNGGLVSGKERGAASNQPRLGSRLELLRW